MADKKENADETASFAAATRHLMEFEIRSAATMHLMPNRPEPGATVPTQHLVPPSPPPPPPPPSNSD